MTDCSTWTSCASELKAFNLSLNGKRVPSEDDIKRWTAIWNDAKYSYQRIDVVLRVADKR